MKNYILQKILTLTLLSLFSFTAYSQEQPWKLKAEKDGIQIYNRSVDYSKIKELKLNTTVKSSLGALVNILNDVALYPEWMYGCRKGQCNSPVADSQSYVMTRLQFPKPFSDRVMFLTSNVEQDTNTNVVTLKTACAINEGYQDNNTVVIEDMNTTWILTPKSSGEIEIESYLFCDPGGHVPAWLINRLMDRGPFRSIQNLVKRLEEPSFQNVTLANIREE